MHPRLLPRATRLSWFTCGIVGAHGGGDGAGIDRIKPDPDGAGLRSWATLKTTSTAAPRTMSTDTPCPQHPMTDTPCDIGTPGIPWGAPERAAWLARQQKRRDFGDDVATPVRALADRFDVVQYGTLAYDIGQWPLLGLRTRGLAAGPPNGSHHGWRARP